MRISSALVPLTVGAALVAAVTVAPTTVFGATATNHHFLGWAGGSALKAVGTTVTSDLTSSSTVDTTATGVSKSNTVASADVSSLLSAGGITTSAATQAITGGVAIVTKAQTLGVSLLGGAITVQAVNTTDAARVVGDNVYSDISTTFAGIKIVGVKLPVDIPKNFQVNIPGVANVVLNATYTAAGPAGSGTLMTSGAGLYVSLLKARGNSPIGTEVFLNPTYAAISTLSPVTGATIGGYAYGSEVLAKAGQLLNAKSGPQAQITQPINGTSGKDKTNNTAHVDLGAILQLGAISSNANGVKSDSTNYSTMTTKLAGVNLFNGLIKADALTGVAHVTALPDGSTTATTSTSLVNLVIAGQSIPVDVSPNTVINVANLGKITIRAEAKTASQALVKVLDIKISTAGYGLPVGAEVQIGVAAAWVVTA
jgi:hypothetical protein